MVNQHPISNSDFQQELNRINTELELEDEMENASNVMELLEIFEEARRHGASYSSGFIDGFEKGVDLFLGKSIARQQSIQDKYNKLRAKWGYS